MDYKLIDEKTASEIKPGDTVKTFRGEKYKLVSFTPPKHAGSTGRVHLEDDEGNSFDYYPGVINAKIIPLLKTAELTQATAVTINVLRKAIAELQPPQKYIVQTISDPTPWDDKQEAGIKHEGDFDAYADAFRKAMTLLQREGGYIEIVRGDELIWDSVHGRSNV